MGLEMKRMGAVFLLGIVGCMGLPDPSFGREENGVDRGGGQGVEDSDGSIRLRDLLSGSGTCEWTDGLHFQRKIGEPMKRLLNTIRSGNEAAYFRLIYDSKRVAFCMHSGRLRPLPASEQDGVTIYRQGTQQVAVRVDDEVYVDSELFRKMPGADQAALFLHEMAHEYSGWDNSNPTRMTKIRTFVKAVAARAGGKFTTEEFRKLQYDNGIWIVERGRYADSETAAGNAMWGVRAYLDDFETLKVFDEMGFIDASPARVLFEVMPRSWDLREKENLPEAFDYVLKRVSKRVTPEYRTFLVNYALLRSGSLDVVKKLAESGPWDPMALVTESPESQDNLELNDRENSLRRDFSLPIFALVRAAGRGFSDEPQIFNYLLNRFYLDQDPQQIHEKLCGGTDQTWDSQYESTRKELFEFRLKLWELPFFKNAGVPKTCFLGETFLLLKRGEALEQVLSEVPEKLTVGQVSYELSNRWENFKHFGWSSIEISDPELALLEAMLKRLDTESVNTEALLGLVDRLRFVKDRLLHRAEIDGVFAKLVALPEFDPRSEALGDKWRDTALFLAADAHLPQTVSAILARSNYTLSNVGRTVFLRHLIDQENVEVLATYLKTSQVNLESEWGNGNRKFRWGSWEEEGVHSAAYHGYCNKQIRKLLDEAGFSRGLFEGSPDCPSSR